MKRKEEGTKKGKHNLLMRRKSKDRLHSNLHCWNNLFFPENLSHLVGFFVL